MKRFTLFAVIMLLLSVNVFATKRALVIGIGEQKDRSWSKINGDNDVKYVIDMLNICGYRDHITTLVNNNATKSGIVSAFKKLANKCKPGDVVYIHFSGHGQRVMDNKTKRESWVPYDAYKQYCQQDKGDKHLMDYEINKLLKNITNNIGSRGKLLVVVDACCSEGTSRGDDDDTTPVRWTKDIFQLPSPSLPTQELSLNWIELSACKNFQKAWEIKDMKVGKLTYALYNIAKNGRVDRRSIEKFMQNYNHGMSQDPVETRGCSYNIWDVLK